MSDTRFHFCFSTPRNGKTIVAIHSNSYDKRLKFAQELLEALRGKLLSQFTVSGEPEIHILGGDRFKRMLSIQVEASYRGNDSEAKMLLEAQGFQDGLELILG